MFPGKCCVRSLVNFLLTFLSNPPLPTSHAQYSLVTKEPYPPLSGNTFGYVFALAVALVWSPGGCDFQKEFSHFMKLVMLRTVDKSTLTTFGTDFGLQ